MDRDLIVAGPILRHVSSTQFTLWLVTQKQLNARLIINDNQQSTLYSNPLDATNCSTTQVGTYCFVHLIHINLNVPLPTNTLLHYDLIFKLPEGDKHLNQLLPDINYTGQNKISFSVPEQINSLMHGSCRKPHHYQDDALSVLDDKLQHTAQDHQARPAMLIMSGDQVYVDDVAGPMLSAIHQTMQLLGLFEEQWQGTDINNTTELLNSLQCYYARDQLLPDDKASQKVLELFLGGKRKPIFTAVGAHNHLITFSEMIAMYCLVWSPTLWQHINLKHIKPNLPPSHNQRYDKEQIQIEKFVNDLSKVRRALAHVPTYMIFDDHDVTDDWNLTRGWEEAAYGNPYSKRIIGNALLAYWLCQGWGNKPENYTELAEQIKPQFTEHGLNNHDQAVQNVLDWPHWHYYLNTQPKVIVLDTRTHRWRSETNPNKPSGLMDWETLSELQSHLINEPSVIMVSPAPVFGVKLIEAIQHIFTFFGKPLMVDAENWMAHPGSANVILNIFKHLKTPPNFIILSGDVHYSFAYDVTLRFRRNSPRILQITASGLKNAFPETLLRWLDKINRTLYSHRSPLNWLTKRRYMSIKRRLIKNDTTNSVLFNHAAIGEIVLADNIDDVQVKVHTPDGREIEFECPTTRTSNNKTP
ncbi:alkaline phosphatase D family protein [Algibacillus agarilyticus]|uniref:alkaline phosphatase D family protein n=1 Tax=Algibacillus agarilyticus TaxID=2234133 RepID=UPI000DD04B51|nr:alkaline phosphatase D family protein [Algibacillus agarilyticus]